MDFDTERDKKALFDRISVELDDQRVIEAMLRVPREEFVPLKRRTWRMRTCPWQLGMTRRSLSHIWLR